MNDPKYHLGMIGLGVMGSNLLLNMANQGYDVVGYDKNSERVKALGAFFKGSKGKVFVTDHIEDFISSLQSPRLIMILVPSGNAVDAVIEDLLPFLEPGDILIDGGNSFFLDTERRQTNLTEKGIFLLGLGISGGEEGARLGPCFMPGGNPVAYEKVRPILESIAARVLDEPCITYIGPGGAGHYVKMVHNGIEYGIIQLISETYDIFRRGLELDHATISRLYFEWNDGDLNSYLLEATARIFTRVDPNTKQHLVDLILDVSEEKGTGLWASEEGLRLREPLPIINAAVVMRDLSSLKKLREKLSSLLQGPSSKFQGEKEDLQIMLRHAFYASMILTYIQGMNLLFKASKTYGYHLNLEKIAQIWRGGCIIRATLLNQMMVAYQREPDLETLLLDPFFEQELSWSQNYLRKLIAQLTPLGIPVPALMASLGYYDAVRSERLPANLVQAQRDYFGAHTYKRVDKAGSFHTEWSTRGED